MPSGFSTFAWTPWGFPSLTHSLCVSHFHFTKDLHPRLWQVGMKPLHLDTSQKKQICLLTETYYPSNTACDTSVYEQLSYL